MSRAEPGSNLADEAADRDISNLILTSAPLGLLKSSWMVHLYNLGSLALQVHTSQFHYVVL